MKIANLNMILNKFIQNLFKIQSFKKLIFKLLIKLLLKIKKNNF